MIKEFIKSIFAGLMIGIACLTSLGAGGGYQGAILFSIGLMVIVVNGYNLYTGKIGYLKSYKELPKMLLYIIGNAVGIILISLCTSVSTEEVMINKLSTPLYLTFAKAIGCGFLMYIAVNMYKVKGKLYGVIGCVPAFILSGFEHSIADMFYICRSGTYNLKTLVFLLVVIIGNAIGALLHKLL